MATKVKPSRIQSTGTPQVGQVPVYVDEDTFGWGTGGGNGDVAGPASSTDGDIVLFDGTTGKLIKDSGVGLSSKLDASALSNNAYGGAWDGDTTHAPTKDAVYDKINSMDTAIGNNTSAISTINGKIPSAATTSNQLADKNYVDDSINSVTAYYITKDAQGDQWATRAELFAATTFYSGGVVRVPTKNDYTIVLSDEQHDNATTRYIYNNGWEYQYTVNETALTQAQLNALNSGITAAKVTTYDGYASDIASKQDELVSGVNIRTINGTSILGNGDITTPVGGDVYGPASSTDGHIVLFDGATGKSIKDGSKSVSDFVQISGNQTIAGTKTFSTSPVVPNKTTAAANTGTAVATEAQVYKKQDKLVSGTNIKKINNNSLLGSGNLTLNDVKVSATAPSSPTEGMVWYDTTNDQLKVYDGTNWNVTGKEYTDGNGINIDANNEISNTGVLSVNGQTGDVAVNEVPTGGTNGQVLTQTSGGVPGWQNPTGGIELAPNTVYNIKYHWYGPQTTYDNLQQYYTDEEDDTAYFTTN